MSPICDACQAQVIAWIDAYQGFGPITRWRQYSTNPESARVRSAEIYRAHVDDRAALIRQQVELIRKNCKHLQREVAA